MKTFSFSYSLQFLPYHFVERVDHLITEIFIDVLYFEKVIKKVKKEIKNEKERKIKKENIAHDVYTREDEKRGYQRQQLQRWY